MFGDGLAGFHGNDPADEAAAMATFHSLLARLQRAPTPAGWSIDDLQLAGQVVWSTVHGHMTIELTGYFESTGRDAGRYAVYARLACLRRMGLALARPPTRGHVPTVLGGERAGRASRATTEQPVSRR